MRTFGNSGRYVVLAALAIASAAGWAVDTAHQATTYDPIDRPSAFAARGASSFLISIANTGKRLVAVGERGIILASDDDGKTWSQASTPVSVLLTAVKFANSENGWAIGHSGVVLHTADGGKTWNKQFDGKKAAELVYTDVKAAADTKPADQVAKRALLDAERLVSDGADKPFFDIHVVNEKVALIVGAYGLFFRTQDGGESWQPWQSHLPNSKGFHLYSIQSSGKSIFLAGEQGALFVSNDNATTFRELKSPYVGSFFGIAALSDKNLVAYGLRGNSFWSADGGKTWDASSSGTTASLMSGIIDQNGSLLLVTLAGNIIRSEDGGRSFRPIPVQSPFPFSGIARANDGALILAGARGINRLSAVAQTAP